MNTKCEIKNIYERLNSLSILNLPSFKILKEDEAFGIFHHAISFEKNDLLPSTNELELTTDNITFPTGLHYLPQGLNTLNANKIIMEPDSWVVFRPNTNVFTLKCLEIEIRGNNRLVSWGAQGMTGATGSEGGRWGKTGGKGGKGGIGLPTCNLVIDLGQITITGDDLENKYNFAIRTEPGNGGNGGTGGQGGRGKDAECLGSDGGDGGRGGDGGDGGDGGQGSTLQVKGRLTQAYDLNRILFEAPGGKPGGNGKYGFGGAGGASINCGLYLRGSGDPGSWGQIGNAGKRGIPGALLLDIE